MVCVCSTRFTYMLGRLKPRASKFKEHLAKVYNIFDTVIGHSYICYHKALYFLKQHFSKFPCTVALHFRILQNFKHTSSISPLLNLIKHFIIPLVVRVGDWDLSSSKSSTVCVIYVVF